MEDNRKSICILKDVFTVVFAGPLFNYVFTIIKAFL